MTVRSYIALCSEYCIYPIYEANGNNELHYLNYFSLISLFKKIKLGL
jgi:hypothetical protein